MNKPWYLPDGTVDIQWIEDKARFCVENFIEVDRVYMSDDVYRDFVIQMSRNMRHHTSGPCSMVPHQVISIITSAGPLYVHPIGGFTNFCHVGTEMSYNDFVRVEVDEAFEAIVLKDCERE